MGEHNTREMLLVADTTEEIIGIVDLHPFRAKTGLAYSICVFDADDLFEISFTPEVSIVKQIARVSLQER